MNIDRRKFLGALALGTAHMLFENPLYGNVGRFAGTNPLQKITLGKSGLQTTLLGFGCGVSASNRTAFLTRQDHGKSVATLRHAYDRGVRMFDNADSYGTHGIMAEALKGMDREALMLSSKIWTRGGGIPEPERPDANVVVERFRKELNTDYIDLYQHHFPDSATLIDETLRALEDLVQQGKVRFIGCSNYSGAQLTEAAAAKGQHCQGHKNSLGKADAGCF